MQYESKLFALPDKNTMTKKDGSLIKEHTHLSKLDIIAINTVYGCNQKTRKIKGSRSEMKEAEKTPAPFVPVAGKCNKVQMSICNYYKSAAMNYQCGGGDEWFNDNCYCEGAAAVTAAPKTQCLKNRVSASRCKKYHGMANVGFVCGDSGYNGKWFDRNCCKFCEELNGPVPAGTVPDTAAVRCDGPQADEARCRGYYMQRGWRCDQSNNHNKWYSQNCCKYCSF